MKKQYGQPIAMTIDYCQQLLNTISGGGIPFAGDDNGTHTPSSRRGCNSQWDEEEDEWEVWEE